MNYLFIIILILTKFPKVSPSGTMIKNIQNDFTWHGGCGLSYHIKNINGDSVSIQGAA